MCFPLLHNAILVNILLMASPVYFLYLNKCIIVSLGPFPSCLMLFCMSVISIFVCVQSVMQIANPQVLFCIGIILDFQSISACVKYMCMIFWFRETFLDFNLTIPLYIISIIFYIVYNNYRCELPLIKLFLKREFFNQKSASTSPNMVSLHWIVNNSMSQLYMCGCVCVSIYSIYINLSTVVLFVCGLSVIFSFWLDFSHEFGLYGSRYITSII